jgi:hypothetical protein
MSHKCEKCVKARHFEWPGAGGSPTDIQMLSDYLFHYASTSLVTLASISLSNGETFDGPLWTDPEFSSFFDILDFAGKDVIHFANSYLLRTHC